MHRLLLVLAALAAVPALAQPRQTARIPEGVDAPKPLVVMNLAAHPDDEDGPTLAYYRGHRDVMAYSVIFTRGEGGQNEAGPELYERLGAIRTAETEAAGRVLGTQVFFLNHYDFGFSKHAREAFAEWGVPRRSFWEDRPATLDLEAGRDSVISRLVYLYRKLKPDVVFTNHDTVTVGDDRQHGHHQAVGISGYEAFALAADPTYHPEQLAEPGVDLWQVRRLFLRRGGFSGGVPEAYDVAVPVSDTCAATAYRPEESCADRAVAAAALHVSQGFDKFAPRFYRDTTYFHLLRQSDDAPPLPAGATDLTAGLALDTRGRGMTWPGYVDAGRIDPVRGLVAPTLAVPGDTILVRFLSDDPEPEAIVDGPAVVVDDPVRDGDGWRVPIAILRAAKPTLPAFARQYDRYESSPPLLFSLQSGGRLRYSYLPTRIAPPVVADLAPDPIRLERGDNTVNVSLATYGGAVEQVSLDFSLTRDGEVVQSGTEMFSPRDSVAAIQFEISNRAEPGAYTLQVVGQDLPGTFFSRPYVEERPAVLLPEIRVAEGLRVGFVRSYDGTMADALENMGATVVDLDSAALASGAFDGLHTIVVDIRAYLDRNDLRAHNRQLIDWVREGGHLVVGYQKSFEWNEGGTNPLTSETNGAYAPFPLRLGRERVTMEDAPVTLAEPEHVLFQSPYAIADADWDGWVQERGLYFPTDDADPRYARLLSMSDTGEDALTTALLLADVGEGTYLYSPLVWYRQLAALNPGAWRLFANLVSLPLTDGRAGAP